jgi:hypothetical protein
MAPSGAIQQGDAVGPFGLAIQLRLPFFVCQMAADLRRYMS